MFFNSAVLSAALLATTAYAACEYAYYKPDWEICCDGDRFVYDSYNRVCCDVSVNPPRQSTHNEFNYPMDDYNCNFRWNDLDVIYCRENPRLSLTCGANKGQKGTANLDLEYYDNWYKDNIESMFVEDHTPKRMSFDNWDNFNRTCPEDQRECEWKSCEPQDEWSWHHDCWREICEGCGQLTCSLWRTEWEWNGEWKESWIENPEYCRYAVPEEPMTPQEFLEGAGQAMEGAAQNAAAFTGQFNGTIDKVMDEFGVNNQTIEGAGQEVGSQLEQLQQWEQIARDQNITDTAEWNSTAIVRFPVENLLDNADAKNITGAVLEDLQDAFDMDTEFLQQSLGADRTAHVVNALQVEFADHLSDAVDMAAEEEIPVEQMGWFGEVMDSFFGGVMGNN